MIASIIQTAVVLIFCKVNRRSGEAAIEETEILKRKRGQRISSVLYN